MTPPLTFIAVCATVPAIAFAVLWLMERSNRKLADRINARLRDDVAWLRSITLGEQQE